MTTIERLVTMVNQIAANRMYEPDPAAATAEHMRLFWDPRMKRMIRDHDGSGLCEVAAAAIEQLGAAHDGT
jgi:formate dehydrogenase subunit delta